MKNLIIIIFIFLKLCFLSEASESVLLRESLKAMKLFSKTGNNAESIIERISFDEPQFDVVRNEIRKDRSAIVVLLSDESVDPAVKTLVLKLSQTLNSRDYLRLIGEILEGVKSSKIERKYLFWACRPREKHLRNMWSADENIEERAKLAMKLKEFHKGHKSQEDFYQKVANNELEHPSDGYRDFVLLLLGGVSVVILYIFLTDKKNK